MSRLNLCLSSYGEKICTKMQIDTSLPPPNTVRVHKAEWLLYALVGHVALFNDTKLVKCAPVVAVSVKKRRVPLCSDKQQLQLLTDSKKRDFKGNLF